MITLIQKELRGFFSTIMGYVVVGVFLTLLGLYLWVFPGEWNIFDGGEATLNSLFVWAPWVLMFVIPAITMRSFADEFRTGTIELLLTKPISEGSIILAKFFGAFAVLALSVLLTSAYVIVVGFLGATPWNLDLGAIYGSYAGLLLLGSAFASIGIFFSACTPNALVAFLTSVLALLLGFIGFDAISDFSNMGSADWLITQLGMEAHYRSLSRGVLTSEDIGYFLLVDFIFLRSAQWRIQSLRGSKSTFAVQWLLSLAIGVVVWNVTTIWPVQFDVTEEGRYTVTESSSELLANLEDEIFVTCYLSGSYPANWKRLEHAIRHEFEEFSHLANGKFRFQFVDIYEVDDRQTQGQNEKKLVDQGLQYTRIAFDENGVQAFKTIWPCAVVNFRNEQAVVQFFKSESPEPTDLMIQSSINNIEYELTRAIRKITRLERPSIALVEGHGELNEAYTADFVMDLEEDYDVLRVELGGQLNILSERLDGMANRTNRFDLAIIAKPDSAFDLKDQVILDQFIMNGGRVLWLIDPLKTDVDSLATHQMTMATTNDLGLFDQLFQYGIRLNRNLIVDLQCAPIVMGAGPLGNQQNMQMFNWYFAPVSIPQGNSHPISSNLDPIRLDFTSSLDVVEGNGNLKKTILLSSSELSREYKAPVRVASSIVELTPEYFSEYPREPFHFAALVEGEFESAFQFRLPDTLKNDPDFAFRSKSVPTAQIIVSDGDIIKNQVKPGPNGPMILPLGFDRYAGRVVYDNKEFLRNAVSYLLDDEASISVRSRAISLRPLHSEKVRLERKFWQGIALLAPLVLLMVLGVIFIGFRRHKFSKSA